MENIFKQKKDIEDLVNDIDEMIKKLNPDNFKRDGFTAFEILMALLASEGFSEESYNAGIKFIEITSQQSAIIADLFDRINRLFFLESTRLYSDSLGWIYAKFIREPQSYLLKIGKTTNIERRSSKEYGPQEIDTDLCAPSNCINKAEISLRYFAEYLTNIIVWIQEQQLGKDVRLSFSYTPKTGKVDGKHDYFRFFINEKSYEYTIIRDFLKSYFFGLASSVGSSLIFYDEWVKVLSETRKEIEKKGDLTISIEDYLKEKRNK